ncbi:MAG: HDOD domain-containing protein [Burkholderiales bacterium]|nr:HDOD domain-containing protein [Burkholderiales bacterium]
MIDTGSDCSLAPGPTPAAGITPAAPGAARLDRLFRNSRRAGRLNPLRRLIERRPGAAAAAPAPAQAPALAVEESAVAPLRLEPDEVRRRVAELPPLPQAALRALATLRSEEATLASVAVELACDASLTARVLRLANSPFYGVSNRVVSTRDAVQLVGRRTLESMLTLAAVASQFEAGPSPAFDPGSFWRHALGSAIAARGLARGHGIDEDQAFVAGLLHNIGLLAMRAYFPQALESLVLHARARDLEISAVEAELGMTPHAEVGAWIAAHWNFPPAVTRAIACHHQPARAAPADAGLTACVHVANAIVHALDLARLPDDMVPLVDVAAWQRVVLPDPVFASLFDEVEVGVDSLAAALEV